MTIRLFRSKPSMCANEIAVRIKVQDHPAIIKEVAIVCVGAQPLPAIMTFE